MSPVDVLTMFGNMVMGLVSAIATFLLSFLPDGDVEVYAVIDGFGNVGVDSTFDVFYFVDFGAVLVCFGVLIVTMIVCTVLKLMCKGIDYGHKAVESVPVVE